MVSPAKIAGVASANIEKLGNVANEKWGVSPAENSENFGNIANEKWGCRQSKFEKKLKMSP